MNKRRINVAEFINAPSADNIVWSQGATDSLNIICQSWANSQLKTGDTIVVLGSEHH